MSTKHYPLIIIVIAATMLSACESNTLAPPRNCEIQSLLYDPKQFNLPKEGLEEDIDIESPVHEAPPISAEYSFYYGKGLESDLIQNWVFRYKFIEQAIDFYNSMDRHMSRTDVFQISEDFENWKMLDGSRLQPRTNQYHAACGVSLGSGFSKCEYIARYEEYFVLFQIGLDTKTLTIEDFVNGVKKIDEQMVACISQK